LIGLEGAGESSLLSDDSSISAEAILRSHVNVRRMQMKDKMRGKVEEIEGKVSGDKVHQFKGKARQKVGGVKEATKSIAYDLEHSSKKGSDAPMLAESS
jgi:uncharacterized protein YjbJ (UPF0337 family)